ncbi:DUF4890 domain-containing protein [Algoriphagus aquimarinus]|uniref:DUF4890 domain-containing protein n=1 Tax=Algoriphagus aquimarinus TaxID=237018 RepID=A0A1I0VWH9_9BACT|nr:DUF4890 domain-containing protein [Algoriphagus aquimarinus]SFA80447.1 protein of unknown function [Algoriphagus aquimarinus]|tara:strand:- start:139479 stop:139901 length:423 start_codon:yes stop_codon:yes gene_type:complete
MKKWIFAAGLMVMVSLSTFAQRNGGQRQSAEERAKMNTERMAEELKLTDAQKKQILDINLEYAKKNEAEMAERKADSEARKEEMEAKKAELSEQETKIQAVLTEEQKVKWAELQAKRTNGQRGGPQGGGDSQRGKRGGGN